MEPDTAGERDAVGGAAVAGKNRWRAFNLEDFDLSLLKRMAVEDIVSFSRARMKATSGSTWAHAAEEFKVRSFSCRDPSMRSQTLTSSFSSVGLWKPLR